MMKSKNLNRNKQVLNFRYRDGFVTLKSLIMSLSSLMIIWFLFCAITTNAQENAQVNDWENPSVIGINKEKAHATFVLPSEKASDSRVSIRWYLMPQPLHLKKPSKISSFITFSFQSNLANFKITHSLIIRERSNIFVINPLLE